MALPGYWGFWWRMRRLRSVLAIALGIANVGRSRDPLAKRESNVLRPIPTSCISGCLQLQHGANTTQWIKWIRQICRLQLLYCSAGLVPTSDLRGPGKSAPEPSGNCSSQHLIGLVVARLGYSGCLGIQEARANHRHCSASAAESRPIIGVTANTPRDQALPVLRRGRVYSSNKVQALRKCTSCLSIDVIEIDPYVYPARRNS